MRSAKVHKEPLGRRCRTPRRKARCLTARRSRRCPSAALVAWSDAVNKPVTGKDVAARFRRGDVLLKPQHEPDKGRHHHDARRGAGGANRPFRSAQRRRTRGARWMAQTRGRGDAGTRGRRDGAEVRQRRRSPPLSPSAKRRGTHARTRRRASDEPGVQGLDEVFSYPEQVDPASSCGKARARTRGKNQVMARGVQTKTRAPGRRSGDFGSARAF